MHSTLSRLAIIIITIYYLVHYLGFSMFDDSTTLYYPLDDIAVNCGSSGNSTALDGREWIGDFGSIGKSTTSLGVHQYLSADPVPYMTARISRSQFTYTFRVRPGQKFIRLHFYPSKYIGFLGSKAAFSVKAGPYTLLSNFSPSLAADALGVKFFAREFCVNVDDNQQALSITFTPSPSTISEDVYAFINGIEVVSMPAGLYYTRDDSVGTPVVGSKYSWFHIDNIIALEMVYRLNIGGRTILPVEDLGMFRTWSEDRNYLLESGGAAPIRTSMTIKYKDVPTYVAPLKVYQTAWSMAPKDQEKKMFTLTRKLSVDLGFRYLIRLHFCELEYNITEAGQREFSIFINNKMAETSADVIKWSGGNGVAVYRDYMVTMAGDRLDSKRDIIITLKPKPNSNAGTKLSNPMLNGLEIFKLSNPDNNLAGPNPMHIAHALTSWTPNLIKFFLAYGIGNVLVVLTLLNIIVCQLNHWGANSGENNTPSSDEEEFCRRFSFVEIQLATNNFDDAFVIGNGGFGKVYRGFIDCRAKTIAIKRLKLESKQGAVEFQMEIEALSTFHHVHLVSLIGYCDEGREMILVYEYMAYGTLADHLYKIHKKGNGGSPLYWEQRLKICIGAARGLDYLHTSRGEQRGLIHRDVKSSNILLDENWVAKISDFGLSKMEAANLSCTHISTAVKGTFGYLDPEYFMTRRLTSKSDVYAFGVVLLEVLCGRPAVDLDLVEEQHSLVLWAQFCIKEGRLGQIVDTNVKDQISTHGLKRFAQLASRCVHKHPSERPTMAEVVAGLELILEQPGRAYSDTEEDDINYEQISNRLTEAENISKVDDNIVAGEAIGTELPRMKRFHASSREPRWGWRWDSLWRRTRPSKAVIFLVPEVSCPRFSFSDILYATGSFNASNCIGSSGFGATYKAEISPGLLVAIKRLAIRRFQGLQQFDAEIKTLGSLHHPNLVTLIAYHASEAEMFLIYNYLPGGNLEKFIRERSARAVDWRVLHKIALDIARALAYMHNQCVPRVLHRDVKPSNILLDDDSSAYLSDFGLARLLGTSETHATTGVAGTFGYVAPEYAMTCRVSDKADVYSYGVVLLELISDKKALDPSFSPYGNGFNIVAWACMLLQQSRAQEFFTAGLWDAGPHDDLVEVLRLAVKCTVDSLSTRATMKQVVRRLTQLQPPSC